MGAICALWFLFLAADIDAAAYLVLLPVSPSLSPRLVLSIVNRAAMNRPPLSRSLARSLVSSSLQSMIPACLLVLIPGAVFIARAREIRPAAAAAAAEARTEFPGSLLASSAPLTRLRCRRPNKYQINETAARNLDVLITSV